MYRPYFQRAEQNVVTEALSAKNVNGNQKDLLGLKIFGQIMETLVKS